MVGAWVMSFITIDIQANFPQPVDTAGSYQSQYNVRSAHTLLFIYISILHCKHISHSMFVVFELHVTVNL